MQSKDQVKQMKANRALWKAPLRKAFAPPWPCPKCADGKMRLQKDTFHFEETAKSRLRHGDDDFDELQVEFVFSAILECGRCKEKVSCCGIGGYEPEQRWNDDGEFYTDYSAIFFPRFFSTPMPIFLPPKGTPGKIKDCLDKSFSVFFCDHSAAANHIRQCAEEILTHAGFSAKNAKGRFATMENRIQSFKSTDQENAERVSALRWIGNFGSHPETLTEDKVFDAYDILEVLLEDLYIGHHRSVRDLVNQINTSKSP